MGIGQVVERKTHHSHPQEADDDEHFDTEYAEGHFEYERNGAEFALAA